MAGVLGVLIIIGASLFMIMHPRQAPVQASVASNPDTAVIVTKNASTSIYGMTISYPNDPRDAAHTIPIFIEALIMSQSKQWTAEAASTSPEFFHRYQLWVDYATSTSQKLNIRCYDITITEDTGGAHPNGSLSSHCFATNNTEVTFDTHFTDATSTLQFLASTTPSRLQKVIGQDMYDPKWATEGTAPTKDNFAVMTIDDSGVTFTFQSYQVGPYAIGRPAVTYSWDELRQYMNPSFKLPLD